MKTFITAALLTATILSTPAMAFGPTTRTLIPDVSFPTPSPETVTQDSAKVGK
ncbi:hypothetical protein [Ruegeria atlantica]|uniref:hypothetical protein n=1 Tax=Ruegeria atlantica TaxID=81569 RepID=UPI00147BCC09|nr:hypothetical protein [Ruegeria atlantica]